MIYGITLILLGLLAVPSLVLAKKPDAKELFDKVAPFQGWIGLVFALWGIWGIISCFLNIGLLSIVPIWWIFWLITVVVEASLGFILGYGLINKYALSKNEKAAAKGEAVLKKLLPLQGTLGIAAIVIGILCIVLSLLLL